MDFWRPPPRVVGTSLTKHRSSDEISTIPDEIIHHILNAENKEDKISTLPDEIIHHILSFVESNVAVQTCVLSKRWVNIWSTLPFLDFEPDHFDYDTCGFYYRQFVNDLLVNRDQQSDIFSVKIDLSGFVNHLSERVFDYAISHNIKKFEVSCANLECQLRFPVLTDLSLSDCAVPLTDWCLPSLTTLHLNHVTCSSHNNDTLLSFPVLKTLHLSHCKVPFMDWCLVSLVNLFIEDNSLFGGKRRRQISFPILETLHLSDCDVHLMDWSLPSLISMHLEDVTCLGNEKELSFAVLKTLHILDCEVPFWYWNLPLLSTLYSESGCTRNYSGLFGFEGFKQLKNITLVGSPEPTDMDVLVATSNATNLTVSQCFCLMPQTSEFIILAPNLSFLKIQGNFVPIFSAKGCLSRVTELNFDIIIGNYGRNGYNRKQRKHVIQRLIKMFHAFQEIKFLTLSFTTIKVLSRISDFSEYLPFPFGKLESLNVLGSTPQSDRLTELPAHVLMYLLSSSPGAMIFIKDHVGEIKNYDPRTNMLIWNSSGYLVANKSKEDTTSDTKSIGSNNVPDPEEDEKKMEAQGQQLGSNARKRKGKEVAHDEGGKRRPPSRISPRGGIVIRD